MPKINEKFRIKIFYNLFKLFLMKKLALKTIK